MENVDPGPPAYTPQVAYRSAPVNKANYLSYRIHVE